MSGWRFYPLALTPRVGVMVSPSRKEQVVAEFLTVGEAKAAALRRKDAA